MTAKVIARADEYNGHKDCLFMMNVNDPRLKHVDCNGKYTIVAFGVLIENRHGKRDDGAEFKVFEGRNGKLYRVFCDWSADELSPDEAPKPTMKVKVCTNCGSANIQRDAWVHLNDPEDVRTFDDLYCENCETSCQVKEVEVPYEFDVYSDIYQESK